MPAYYNENDPFAAAWLRALVAADLIAPGHVDARDVREVTADDVRGFNQVHLFAGIGGWSLALRLAGWPDDAPVWTGSCPCQPFSAAGTRKGMRDKRHLWPQMRRLVAQCRPAICFGEQVASKAGRSWLAGVRADLEALAYAVGAADLCAAGAGAPHIRQRLFWVADHECNGRHARPGEPRYETEARQRRRESLPGSATGGLDDAERIRRTPRRNDHREHERLIASTTGDAFRLANAERDGGRRDESQRLPQERTADGRVGSQFPVNPRLGDAGVAGLPVSEHQALCRTGWRLERPAARKSGVPFSFWSAFELIACADGKARRIEPGTFPLADGLPGRVGRLRGYGNAIVPEAAAQFIRAYIEARSA